jgi:putative ABC transport system permease protein
VLRITLRGLAGHRARLILTGLSIVLGVAFVAGTYVFTDTLGDSFDTLFDDAFAGIDVQVRAETEEDLGFVQASRIPAALLEQVEAVPGVADAWGSVTGYAQFVSPEGEPIVVGGAPTFGLSWPDTAAETGYRLRSGRPPSASGDVVMDASTAARYGFEVGDTVSILLAGPTLQATITGIAGYGDAGSFGGATAALFDLVTAQRIFGAENAFDTIDVVATPGVAAETIVERIAPVLPAGVEAVTGSSAAADLAGTIREGLGFFTTFLLVFAFIALFVGSFIIQNTFRIVVAQRTRELALLRAIGATGAQVTRIVVIESLVVGFFAAAIGLAAGIGLAVGLRTVFESFGASFPPTPIRIAPRTVLVSLGVGVAVTLVAALIPARKAAAVSPMAALQNVDLAPGRRSLRNRAVLGFTLNAIGTAALAQGLFDVVPTGALTPIQFVGVGAAAVFIGIAVLSPVFARPIAAAIGAPFPRLLRVPGLLARGNAMRSPRRTSATASALMVGLALVSGIAILAASARATVGAIIAGGFRADLTVQSAGGGFGAPGAGISPEIAERLAGLPEVDAVARVRANIARVGDDVTFVGGVDPGVTEMFDFEVTGGSFGDLTGAAVAVNAGAATALGIEVGDVLPVEFAAGGTREFRVVALWAADGIAAEYLLSLDAFDSAFTEQLDQAVYLTVRDGIEPATARAAVESVTDGFPNAAVFDAAGFRAEAESQVNRLLVVIVALLALAVVISLIGITNTLSLSVIERTREIGVLRAIGMSRRQVRRMIRWEAVIIAVFGALLGVWIGVSLGWAVVRAFADDGVVFAVPVGQLLTLVAAAGIAGILAAVIPAYRASRLDVLAAIAYE